jgi:hypothetical protein
MQVDLVDRLKAFCESVEALVPILERENIGWKEGEQYHDFDELAELLFETFVLNYLSEELELFNDITGYKYGFAPFKLKSGYFFSTSTFPSKRPIFTTLRLSDKAYRTAVFMDGSEVVEITIDNLKNFTLIQ